MKSDLKLPESQTELLKAVYIAIDLQHEVEFSRIYPRRGNQQRKYYWVLVNYFVNYTGYKKDIVHGIFKKLFGLKKRIKLINCRFKSTLITRSTGDYDVMETKKLLDDILEYLSEVGCKVPTIEEYFSNYCKIENQLEKEENRE